MSQQDVVIVGAGLAGLACARHLHRRGVDFLLLEASDRPGGRLHTERADGYQFDRGFLVFQEAYPEASRQLDYERLDLRSFYPGAMIWTGEDFQRMGDPLRSRDGLETVLSKVGGLTDKFKLGKLRMKLTSGSLDRLFDRDEKTTAEALADDYGFSSEVIDRFFRPFFGGVMLDEKLRTSRHMFDFAFRMMSEGDSSIPAAGIQAIPEQLAEDLPSDALRFESPVDDVSKGCVKLKSGEEIKADAVVVATEAPQAAKWIDEIEDSGSKSVMCIYFGAERSPVDEAILVLDGSGQGPVNNICVPSDAAPEYAPDGQALISATVLRNHFSSEEELVAAARRQLVDWFGSQVHDWEYLRTYHVEHGQPRQEPPTLRSIERDTRIRRGLYVCGDHRHIASMEGAMVSGRHAAESVIEDFRN